MRLPRPFVLARTASLALSLGVAVSAVGCARVLGADFEDKHLACPAGRLSQSQTRPGDLPDLWFALRSFDFGDHGADGGFGIDESVGFDVPGAKSCTVPSWADPPSEATTGKDNAYARAYAEFRELKNVGLPPNGEFASARAENGDFSQLVRIRGYDGDRDGGDDDDVELAFVDGSMGATTITEHARPRWDGTDEWHASAVQLSRDGGLSPAVTTHGTVQSGVVRALVEHATYGLLERFELQARLERTSNGYELRGMLGGATSIRTLFFIAGALVDTAKSLCIGGVAYAGESGFKAVMCRHVDIDLDGDGECDSLTAGAHFTGSPIVVGCPVQYGEQLRCPREIDPQFDACGRP